jgi:hypothetical protein
MSIKLPEPIAAYFAATNAHNVDAMLALFAESAMVQDEGQERRGLAAIREWMEEAIRKYRFTVEVTGVAEANGSPVVTGRVSGTFPGSPVDLRHFFTLAGGKITHLEIHP